MGRIDLVKLWNRRERIKKRHDKHHFVDWLHLLCFLVCFYGFVFMNKHPIKDTISKSTLLSQSVFAWLTLVDTIRNDFEQSTGVDVSQSCSVSMLKSLIPPV